MIIDTLVSSVFNINDTIKIKSRIADCLLRGKGLAPVIPPSTFDGAKSVIIKSGQYHDQFELTI